MTIGILNITLFIPDSNSLKQKRMVLHSLKSRMRKSFNVAIAQIGLDDKWQKTNLAIVGVERDRKIMNRTLSNLINFIENHQTVQLIDYNMELI